MDVVENIMEVARLIQERNGDAAALKNLGLFDLPPAVLQPALGELKLGDRFRFERHQMDEMVKLGRGGIQAIMAEAMHILPAKIEAVPLDLARKGREQEAKRRYVGPEATIDRVISPDMHRSDAKDAIERRHGRYLSGGQATTAYSVRVFVKEKDRYDHMASPDHAAPEYASHFAAERCYRVSSKDEAARRVIDLALEHQDDPYAPKVYAVLDLPFGDWVSEMELLERAHNPGQRADEERMLYGWQLGEDWEYTGRYGKVRPSRLLLEKSPFMRAVDKLRVRIGADYDLHGANVMKRGEQIVVLDPLYKC